MIIWWAAEYKYIFYSSKVITLSRGDFNPTVKVTRSHSLIWLHITTLKSELLLFKSLSLDRMWRVCQWRVHRVNVLQFQQNLRNTIRCQMLHSEAYLYYEIRTTIKRKVMLIISFVCFKTWVYTPPPRSVIRAYLLLEVGSYSPTPRVIS